jgi:hydrogenase maturation protein HypF
MTILNDRNFLPSSLQRLHLQIQGMVQGVGFRPFVYNLATELGLAGWVRNDGAGVTMEVEGSRVQLTAFLERLERERPPHTIFARLISDSIAPLGEPQGRGFAERHFQIISSLGSSAQQTKSAWVLPDLATCPECLREIFTPENRRYYYPFTNCTHCGPRFSILTGLPYDRPQTTMARFEMCPACQGEYREPRDRRFHAQPNACACCGPHLELWQPDGRVINLGRDARQVATLLRQAADWVRQGSILALKGLGGFHLIVDAGNQEAVRRLRERKQRPSKPLALMYPNLTAVQEHCYLSHLEAALLTSATAPIVLLHRRATPTRPLAPGIAPDRPDLGVMLPYTPLHHLLMAELDSPVVATSGNLANEPLCTDEGEAIERLGSIADVFLVHNRPIAHPIDDSIVRVVGGRSLLLRRARGYAPQPLSSPLLEDAPAILALGGHLKNTVALSLPGQVILSQHLGDLDCTQTLARCQETVAQLLQIYEHRPVVIACDAHPDYISSQFAQHLSQQLAPIPLIPVQHHYAHVLSAMVDNDLEPPILGIAWDGTGYGLDGTLWGGEWLTIPRRGQFDRAAHFAPFPLPGGERAVREPRRAALGILYQALGEAAWELRDCPTLQAFSPRELPVLQKMLRRRLNTPMTSSAGRLFEALASLTGLCQIASFEGEGAMKLEFAQSDSNTEATYPYSLQLDATGKISIEWQPMLLEILRELSHATGTIAFGAASPIAAKFHNTMVEIMVAIAEKIGWERIVLTGGCFQNCFLLEQTSQKLREKGFKPYWHQQIPPNDGGIAVGQILGAYWAI